VDAHQFVISIPALCSGSRTESKSRTGAHPHELQDEIRQIPSKAEEKVELDINRREAG
jgi:hypothetical protein